ncbi:short chain dehydrogenase [Moniliophthora roreri MCA 2997]|uniref:Short chain dehydrogenase n=1 Tax=Moniliophthora roreri (strain MCA 2997) TaxID=1381753 RepID=V2X0L6_MONRO|nr:short chain dehydrogenase [Moniliophthora roreri MCA 2997]
MTRVILVTGSNTGIGLALVKLLASKPEKHTVYLAARNEKAGNDALKALHDEGISNVKFAQLDVTSKSSIQSAVETISKAEGKLDVLVHNAGLARLDAPQNASSVDTDVIKDTMEVNFYGVIHTTQAFLPLLRKSAKPVILLVSTDMASNTRQSRPDSYLHVVAYNTSKAAANSYLIALANELKNDGFRVNAVTPGFTTTKLNGFAQGGKTTEKAAELLSEWALLEGELEGKTGLFWSDKGEFPW